MGLDAEFLNVSFVGAASLAKSLGDDGDGVIVTQVVPHVDSELAISQDFREAMAKLDTDLVPTSGSFEGYTAARILLKAMAQIDGPPTRESIVSVLEQLGEFNIGFDQPLYLDSREHQASHRVWPTVLKNGEIVPFQWDALKPDAPVASVESER